MDIPAFLETQILEGKAVLLFGAGASRDARDAAGRTGPLGRELGNLLADKFLGGKFKDKPLDQIGELAISEANLAQVQGFIRDIFDPLNTTDSHRVLASFRWWGLATTNYDRVVEKAYAESSSVQKLRPVVEDNDPIQDWMRDGTATLYLKLHGCITRSERTDCPLILTPDQYIFHRQGRDRIFRVLEDWAIERSIIFIGHSLQDADIRAVLLRLTSDLQARTRHYIVAPDADDAQVKMWEMKKISVLKGTLADFSSTLDLKVPKGKRALLAARPVTEHPFSERIAKAGSNFSDSCVSFLTRDVEYVKASTKSEALKPSAFYRGMNPGWAAVEQKLDVRRNLADTITADHLLTTGERGQTQLLLIRAHAGSGKSVLLKRLAWDAAHEYNLLALYLNPHGVISAAALQEIIGLCNERVFLFVDNAGERIRELSALLAKIGPEGRMLTVIATERTNEWNIVGGAVAPFVTETYDLPYLRENEIDSLLNLLDKHDSLGSLKALSHEERRQELSEMAGRQLLVALHEATYGKRFEEIVESEFNEITPLEAQRIYLTICVLNRLGVAVRAGIVSRIHGIDFAEFSKKLFAPLEEIVHAEWNPIIRDYMYRARHPRIAEMVFERILKKPQERFDHYLRCLQELNVTYETDRTAFRRMIRGRAVIDLFPDHQMAKTIYREAERQAASDAYYYHQLAIYELNRTNGNLAECEKLLLKATTLNSKDPTIKHSMAEYYLHCAETARTSLEKDQLLRKAAEISSQLKGMRGAESPSFHTLIKIGITRLQDASRSVPPPSDDVLTALIKSVEQDLSDGLQQFPGEPYLLDAEAKLAILLSDSQRAVDALTKAFSANPRNASIAIRLADLQKNDGAAAGILKSALESNPSDRRLHYTYGKLLMTMPAALPAQLLYHFQRGYTDGDRHFDARLLHGRQLFISGEFAQSRELFGGLEKAQVAPETRDRPLYQLPSASTGEIDKLESSYSFIARDGDRQWIYCSRRNVDPAVWKAFERGLRVKFDIAFTFRGPNAVNVHPLG